ncbi:MAG: redoxin domain-containing protein [Bacteroidetes bacterium]|nr:redoxin domain-containing protein [Bacteroidota bacterium]
MKQFLTLTLIAVLFFSCKQESQKEATTTDTTSVAQQFPEVPPLQPYLELKDIAGSSFNVKDLSGTFAIMFFNPDCDHCQDEARSIHNFKNQFKSQQLYFVSIDSMENIVRFRKDYDLMEPYFHFAQGQVEQIVNAVGPIPGVPCTFIYRDGKLVTRLQGESKPEEILSILNQP